MEKRKEGEERKRREEMGGKTSIHVFMHVVSIRTLLPAGEACQTISPWWQGHKTPPLLSTWLS